MIFRNFQIVLAHVQVQGGSIEEGILQEILLYPKFSPLKKTILEIFQTKHAKNRSDLYAMEIDFL